jgi:hypothetical protein
MVWSVESRYKTAFTIYVTSGGTIPSWHRIYIEIDFGAPAGKEQSTFYWDDTAANNGDSQLYMPGVSIPENVLLLALLAPAIPLIKMSVRNEI